MIEIYVTIDLGQFRSARGRLLAEVPADAALPLLQVYDCGEYFIALKRHSDKRVEHETIWISDDQFDGKCQPVHPLPESEIREQLASFFGDDPRARPLIQETRLR